MMASEAMRCEVCLREFTSLRDGFCDECAVVGWDRRYSAKTATAYRDSAEVCEAMVIGGRAWTHDQEVAARTLFAAAEAIRARTAADAQKALDALLAEARQAGDAAGYARGIAGAIDVAAKVAALVCPHSPPCDHADDPLAPDDWCGACAVVAALRALAPTPAAEGER